MTEKTTLAAAMAKAFGEIEAALKSSSNPHFKSKYADLTSVIETIKPPLIANGLFFTQHPEPATNGIQIETVLRHAGGGYLSLGSLFVPANKNDAQAYGSALTYARRYALVTAFGVPVEDDDGNAASKSPPKHTKQEEPDFIDPDDVTLIMQLCEAIGGNQPKLICDGYKVKTVSMLSKSQGEAVKKRLNEKLAEKTKAETNAKAEEQ